MSNLLLEAEKSKPACTTCGMLVCEHIPYDVIDPDEKEYKKRLSETKVLVEAWSNNYFTDEAARSFHDKRIKYIESEIVLLKCIDSLLILKNK